MQEIHFTKNLNWVEYQLHFKKKLWKCFKRRNNGIPLLWRSFLLALSHPVMFKNFAPKKKQITCGFAQAQLWQSCSKAQKTRQVF